MIFGKTDSFAIEVGELESYLNFSGIYVQFRFWIGKVPVGDWNDRISLQASIENACTILETEAMRQLSPFAQNHASDVFQAVYDAFYSYDYTKAPVVIPNLRDQFHLDEIGMGAIQDKYGLILVATSNSLERVIAKDLRQELLIADVSVPVGFVESVLREFIEWGRTLLRAARG
ncbi:MAG: hypothetical protein JNL58_15545 [Planctomyces sp.]|nr:hypothetical protein [Planctomyces sp.]